MRIFMTEVVEVNSARGEASAWECAARDM